MLEIATLLTFGFKNAWQPSSIIPFLSSASLSCFLLVITLGSLSLIYFSISPDGHGRLFCTIGTRLSTWLL